ncbi:hypothetical protein FOA52_007892 [Chlamydomonas sp. UWO 241]|nr:hypothetical protein FOA52_007892 [Chlamydomonas sp. UWO 241]
MLIKLLYIDLRDYADSWVGQMLFLEGVRFAMDVFGGLSTMQRAGKCHNDLKRGNLLWWMDEYGRVHIKVCVVGGRVRARAHQLGDLGIASQLGASVWSGQGTPCDFPLESEAAQAADVHSVRVMHHSKDVYVAVLVILEILVIGMHGVSGGVARLFLEARGQCHAEAHTALEAAIDDVFLCPVGWRAAWPLRALLVEPPETCRQGPNSRAGVLQDAMDKVFEATSSLRPQTRFEAAKDAANQLKKRLSLEPTARPSATLMWGELEDLVKVLEREEPEP